MTPLKIRVLGWVVTAGLLLAVTALWHDGIRTRLFQGDVGANAESGVSGPAQFERMAVLRGAGNGLSLPQLLFMIDRSQEAETGGQVYWIDSKRFPLHYEFARRSYLTTADLGDFNEANYLSPDRRFIVGSVVSYPALGRYGVELWEGDTIDLTMLQRAMVSLERSFFTRLAFKPNSNRQESLVRNNPGFAVITPEQAYGSRDFLVLNPGRAVGRLRILDDPENADMARSDIVILRSNPVTLEPVAGILTTQFSTPLSHVNLLAGTWNVPNAYLRGADLRYAELAGDMVVLDVRNGRITVRRATATEIAEAQRVRQTRSPRLPRADLSYAALPSLAEQTAADVIRTGAKSANLGEVFRRAAMTPEAGFDVPPGFTIPFHYYDAFVRANGIDRQIAAILADPKMESDRSHRRRRLDALRKSFLAGRMDARLTALVQRRRAQVTGSGGVFARSSTNSEDLPGFNGAGLYTSVPNVREHAELVQAIKTVWSSVWNDRAYEARAAAGIDHRGVQAAVLIQLGVDADASGVLVTGNPFAPEEEGAVFINAKRGLGMRVVEGKKVAEQLIYHGAENTVQVLTRSTDDTMLTFDPDGGVRPVSVDPRRAVLTDELTTRLARAGLLVQQWFGGAPQDIEWLTVGDRIVIVQARPWRPADRVTLRR